MISKDADPIGMKYAEMYSKWYSWGSPIGLGLFFVLLAVVAFIVRLLFLVH